jgi:hypothetical protein
MSHRFILLPYKTPSSRKNCPACGAKREFTPYLDTETGELLPDHVGRCNRELHCGYHYTPKQFFAESKPFISIGTNQQPKEEIKPTSFIEFENLEQSTRGYGANNFYQFLVSLFGKDITIDLCAKYLIGTSKHWPGATIFWQIDANGNVRTGKIMLYDAITGKRAREPYDHITWVHSVLKLPEFNLKQCFFGEHLLSEDLDKTVCIVESEKSAVICAHYFPKFIWIATGGKNGAKWTDRTVSNILKDRKVVLYPDANAFNDWSAKANKLFDFDITVSDYLESKATQEQKDQGIDIADILIKMSGVIGAALVQQPVNLHYPALVQSAGGV